MKKIIALIGSIVLSLNVLYSQDTIHRLGGVYQREYPGDTVHFGDSCFLFNTPYDLDYEPEGANSIGCYTPAVQQYAVTDSTMIYGIAATAYFAYHNNDSVHPVFVLFQKDSGDITWTMLDTVDFDNYYTVSAFEYEHHERGEGGRIFSSITIVMNSTSNSPM